MTPRSAALKISKPVRDVGRIRPALTVNIATVAMVACMANVSAFAATVEFKLSPELKGREQAVANRLAQDAGAAAPVSRGNGGFEVTTTDGAKAAALASVFRERAGVLWAQSMLVDAPLSRAAPETEFHGRLLALTLNPGANAATVISALARRTNQPLTLKRVATGNRALVLLPLSTNGASLAAVAVAAASEPGIRSADRVRVLRHQWIPNNTMFSQQWPLGTGVGGVRAAQAWDLTPSGSVAVAVIDTGIRSHPELDAKLMSGYDMVRNLSIASDGNSRDPDAADSGDFDGDLDCASPANAFSSWHGTHVAGIIAASSNNGEGIVGVAPNARIVPIRALGRCGGIDEDVADSIRWAAGVPVAGVSSNPNPAKVVNLSLGGYGPCTADMQSAVDGAVGRGAVIVVAAGNDASRVVDFSPANCKGVIAVAAGNLLGDLSSYSNFGSGVAITAPGGDFGDLPGVISTLNGGITLPGVPSYATYSGTSMAAPHVAGVVALMLARDPTLSPGQVMNRLLRSARSFIAGSDCASAAGACGAGLLDAAGAVGAVTPNRLVGDLSASNDRVRLIEMREVFTDRFALTADPVEIAQMEAGLHGGLWTRSGFSVDTFSFTAQFNALTRVQPVCRSRLVVGGGFAYSNNVDECKAYAANAGWTVDGMQFLAALPDRAGCPSSSNAVNEFARIDGLGRNLRTLDDAAEISRMVDAGWVQSRIAFCAPL